MKLITPQYSKTAKKKEKKEKCTNNFGITFACTAETLRCLTKMKKKIIPMVPMC